jgi:pSer/pThr/pTyr-binding forkhead associated (FHA) protein
MSVLKSLESRLAGLVEGTFSRAFRSEVRPVEIARKLAREMEENKSISVSRVYVPNEYAVYLSPSDRERFAGYEDALVKELAGYLLEHARAERFALVSRPVVEFRTDERLNLGEFGIQARLVQPPEQEDVAPRQAERGNTMIYSAASRVREPLHERPGGPEPRQGVLLLDGRRIVVGPSGATIGRSRDCEVVLSDANVSRRHAAVVPVAASTSGWAVEDLGSTNGTKLNGRRVAERTPLEPGDRIEVGTTELRFELE